MNTTDYDGAAWQERCMRLLSLRYPRPGVFQRIDSQRLPDGGIEAYASDGTLFQCYAPTEPLSVKGRYAAQRSKLTEDTGKLKKHAAQLTALLGDILVRAYVFMVPQFDGLPLPTHATKRAAEVRSWGLSFITSDFRIVVHTEEDYPTEMAQLARAGAEIAQIELPDLTAEQAHTFAAANAALIQNLESKLAKLSWPVGKTQAVRQSMLDQFLTRAEILQRLRVDHPEIFAAVERVTNARAAILPTESAASVADPGTHLNNVSERHRAQLAQVAGVGEMEAEFLAWGSVADWLMTCPLDFYGNDDV